jgi:lysozyme family protein
MISVQAFTPEREKEYADLAARAVIKPEREHDLVASCKNLIANKPLYQHVESISTVPTAMLMALSDREMNGNVHCYLGNGQSLKVRTTIVPLDRGPFSQPFPDDFYAGCMDALRLEGLDQWAKIFGGWTIPLFCYGTEELNGDGYRRRGLPSPYVFGATTVQKPGKFPRDHFFDPTMMDPQLGTLAIYEELVKQDPSLAFAPLIPKVTDAPPIAVVPHENGTVDDAFWIQSSLNRLHVTNVPLRVDGNIGPGSRAAIRAFEQQQHLDMDRGIPGPEVIGAIKKVMAAKGLPT